MPMIDMTEDGILVITIPDFSGNETQAKQYARTLLGGISPDVQRVILDLRGNTGGNMYPMIAGVNGLLPDGIVLKFRRQNNQQRTNQQQGGKGRKRGADRFKPEMTEAEQEEMQKQIQKQVKETYARMNDNKKNNFGAKYRKEKRELASQRAMSTMARPPFLNSRPTLTDLFQEPSSSHHSTRDAVISLPSLSRTVLFT